MSIYLEYQDDTSAKFWQIEVSGASHTVTYGKIGTQGTCKTKTFDDEAACQKDADKLIRSKKAKGYAEQGQAPTPKTQKAQTPAQKDRQAMMDELDELIKNGNPIKAFDFLHKYKNGNATALKKALPKLRRHWLDWRELTMPSGKTRWGCLGGEGQRKCLAVLMLGLFSEGDYNNQWSFVFWLIEQNWLNNDEMIDRLVAVGCQVMPAIFRAHIEDGWFLDYQLLRKLESVGLMSYDPAIFIAAFVKISDKYIIKHNEHLLRTYRRQHAKRDNLYSSVSKFANQYQHEGKAAPAPKLIQSAQTPDADTETSTANKDEYHQGEVVPFITLDLTAFDDDPVIKTREFRHLFEFEAPLSGAKWHDYGYKDYHNVNNFANPYHQWTAHFISTGDLDRMWVLGKCLEAQTNLWADTTKSYFRALFDYLSPTNEDKILLQDELMALLTHENKPVVNFALGYIKEIYQDERFKIEEYLGYWQSLLMNADNKTAIKTLINQATALLKQDAFTHTTDVLGAICGAFLVNDVSIQEKVAKLIAKHATPSDEMNTVLAMYAPLMNADSRAILSAFLSPEDMIKTDVQTYEYQPDVMDVGENLTEFDDFADWLFALNATTQSAKPYLFEQVLAGYLSLLYADALPDDAHTRIKSVIKRYQDDHMCDITHIFLRSWCKYIYEDAMLKPSSLSHWYGDAHKIYHTWHNILRHFYALIKLYEQKQLTLPLLSTPTHTSSTIAFDVLMDRLMAYQVAGVGVDVSDLAVAMARTSRDVSEKLCQKRLDELDNVYLKEVLACHFGLTAVPDRIPPASWQDKNDDNFVQKFSFYMKEKLSADDLKHQNHFNMTAITTSNWQAWRGLWAVAVLTHRNAHLICQHEQGRVYDKVVSEPLAVKYQFNEIKEYDYTTGKTIGTGTYQINIELPTDLRWSATTDVYRRMAYHKKNHYWSLMYFDGYSVNNLLFMQSLTPHQPIYADMLMANALMSSYSKQAAAYEKLFGHMTSPHHMLSQYAHLALSHMMFHEQKQIRQMASDAISILAEQHRLDTSVMSAHILLVMQKSNLPFVRFYESVARLAEHGGLSACVAQILITHILTHLDTPKLPTGFKKLVELYYVQLTEQGQSPSSDVLTALEGLLLKSSGLKSIITKIKKL